MKPIFAILHAFRAHVAIVGILLSLALNGAYAPAQNTSAASASAAKTSIPTLPTIEQVPNTPLEAPAGTWTLVALPDTQGYSQRFPQVFIRQTEWLVKNQKKHNILFVVHEGDIVNQNQDVQWANARKAMDVLNKGGVPYALAPGNHDYANSKTNRSTLLNKFFSPADYNNSESVVFYKNGEMENSAHTLTTPWGPFLIFALEYGPRDAVLQWANDMAAKYPSHRIIMVTHAHVYSDGTRYNLEKYGAAQRWNPRNAPYAAATGANDGEQVWEKFISKQPGARLVLNGHVLNDGIGYLASKLSSGKTVHQILANYQSGVKPDRGYSGGGYIRLMQFLPDGKTMRVKTYSPLYDNWLTDPANQFEITIE